MTKNTPLAPYIRSFFEDHLACRRNVARNTILSYRDGLKLFLGYAARERARSAAKLDVTEVTEELILGFLADLEAARGNSTQTRNHRLVALHALFEYIGSREPMLLDHCRKILLIPRKRGAPLPEIRYLEKEQVTGIFNAVDRRHPLGRRDYALLLFMYNSGARVQEVVDARRSWLSLAPPARVELLGKGRKWRTCPLWDNTARHLQELIEEHQTRANGDDHLFVNRSGRPLSRSGVADIITRYHQKAAQELPSLRDQKVTPHTLRHTTAMHLLQAGVEVNVIRSWLGHVSIATTNRYIEIDLAMKRKAMGVCEVGPSEPTLPTWRSDPDILAWLESL